MTRSIARVAKRVKAEGDAIAGIVGKRLGTNTADIGAAIAEAKRTGTTDSFQNFGLNLGQGTDNALSGSTYGFNPITRIRTLLEWIYRGSWLGGVAVDVIADDMTRAGIEFGSTLEPEAGQDLQAALEETGVWEGINDTIKWGRLYGGAIGVLLIDGQKMDQPLRLNAIGKNQFKGIMVLDRWMVDPGLNDLVTDMGPSLGLPKFYRITADAPAIPRALIHHSRCIRFEGDRLPYWQRVMENLWGLSVFERLYDRLIAFDSATTGAAQSVYKSYLRTYKIMGMREMIAAGGEAEQILVRFVDMMRRFQGIEGITLIDGNDDFTANTPSNMTGIAEALVQFGQQLAGALQVPLVRLFGQSPAGLNASGESDLRTYEDGIAHRQKRQLKRPLGIVLTVQAASAGIKLPDNFTWGFAPLRQMTDEQKAETAGKVATAVSSVEGTIIGRATALKELKQSSQRTGIFTNITDEEIQAAEDEPAPGPESQEFAADLAAPPGGGPPAPGGAGGAGGEPGGGAPGGRGGDRSPGAPPEGANDLHVHLNDSLADAILWPRRGRPVSIFDRIGRRVAARDDAVWIESQHPRDPHGQFATVAGGGLGAHEENAREPVTGRPVAVARLGSGEGLAKFNAGNLRSVAAHMVAMAGEEGPVSKHGVGQTITLFHVNMPEKLGQYQRSNAGRGVEGSEVGRAVSEHGDGNFSVAYSFPKDFAGDQKQVSVPVTAVNAELAKEGYGDADEAGAIATEKALRTVLNKALQAKMGPQHQIAGELYRSHTAGRADLTKPAERARVARELVASKGPAAVARVQEALDKLAALNGYSTHLPVSEGGFMQPDGRYTPEREAVHDRLLAKLFTPEAIARATPRAAKSRS